MSLVHLIGQVFSLASSPMYPSSFHHYIHVLSCHLSYSFLPSPPHPPFPSPFPLALLPSWDINCAFLCIILGQPEVRRPPGAPPQDSSRFPFSPCLARVPPLPLTHVFRMFSSSLSFRDFVQLSNESFFCFGLIH